MDPNVVAIIGLVLLIVLMALRMPISFVMFIVGFAGLWYISSYDAAVNMLTSNIWIQFSSYSIGVIPLYLFMGEIVFRTGITEKLFDTAYKWIGHIRGGMAGTTILASAGFAAICGSNSATAATMGTIALPELKKYKYDVALSTGTIATGGTLGIIIPPSTVLIIIGLQVQLSIRDLFIASIIPGILLTVLLLLTIIYMCWRNPELGPPGPKSGMKEKLLSLGGVIPVLLLFGFVIGGLYAGWFTPTESGAVGAFGALVIALFMRRLTWKNLKESVLSTLKSAAMVIMLMVGAVVYGRFLTMTRMPHSLAEMVDSLEVAPLFILIAILFVYIIGGSVMDALGFLIISLPIFYPTVIALGYDPVWFAVLLCIVTSMGAITPPVGVCVFVVQGLAPDVPVTTIFRGAAYFLIAYIIFIALLIAFPEIITFVL